MQAVRHQIAEQSRAIAVIFAPAMKVLRADSTAVGAFSVEGFACFYGSKPSLPIDVLGLGFLFDRIIPLTVFAIATVIALTPNQCADLSRLNDFGALLPTAGRTALRANLENLAGLFDHVINFESFIQIARHRLLAINVFAGFESIEGDAGMPRIVGGDKDRGDILALEQLAMIRINVSVLELGLRFGPIAPRREQVTSGSNDGIIFTPRLVNSFEMVLADAEPNSNNRDLDAIVGSSHIGRRRLALAINWCAKQGRRRDRCRRGSSLFDEIPARHT